MCNSPSRAPAHVIALNRAVTLADVHRRPGFLDAPLAARDTWTIFIRYCGRTDSIQPGTDSRRPEEVWHARHDKSDPGRPGQRDPAAGAGQRGGIGRPGHTD